MPNTAKLTAANRRNGRLGANSVACLPSVSGGISLRGGKILRKADRFSSPLFEVET